MKKFTKRKILMAINIVKNHAGIIVFLLYPAPKSLNVPF